MSYTNSDITKLEEHGYAVLFDFFSEDEGLKHYSIVANNENLLLRRGRRVYKIGLPEECFWPLVADEKVIALLRSIQPDIRWAGSSKIDNTPGLKPHKDVGWLRTRVGNKRPEGYKRFRVLQYVGPREARENSFLILSNKGPVFKLVLGRRDLVVFLPGNIHSGNVIGPENFIITRTYSDSSIAGEEIYYREAIRRFPKDYFSISKDLHEYLAKRGISPIVDNHEEFFKKQVEYMNYRGANRGAKDPLSS